MHVLISVYNTDISMSDSMFGNKRGPQSKAMMMLLAFLNLSVVASAFTLGPSLIASNRLVSTRLFEQDAGSSEDISIEYCTGCRWMMRSAWMANELLTTFQDDLDSVTLIPNRSKPGGVFMVKRNPDQVLWDRKTEGGFPESKQLKQRVRDNVVPEKDLGHSDSAEQSAPEDCEDCPSPAPSSTISSVVEPNVSVTYCTERQWLLRASWMAQELLTTFPDELNSVTMIPSRPSSSPEATFRIELNEDVLWDRGERGRFPEAKEIKQMVRDKIAPTKDLGHSDEVVDSPPEDMDEMDDDDAADARQFFGVM